MKLDALGIDSVSKVIIDPSWAQLSISLDKLVSTQVHVNSAIALDDFCR